METEEWSGEVTEENAEEFYVDRLTRLKGPGEGAPDVSIVIPRTTAPAKTMVGSILSISFSGGPETGKVSIKNLRRRGVTKAQAKKITDGLNQAFLRKFNSTGVELSPADSTRLVVLASCLYRGLEEEAKASVPHRGNSRKIALAMMSPPEESKSEIEITAKKIREGVMW